MLENIEVDRRIAKSEYREQAEALGQELAVLQRRAKELGIPLVVVFEGWDAAGKGTLINELIMPLDPRSFDVHGYRPPSDDEAYRPFLWRYWIRTPEKGRLAIFDRGWYRHLLDAQVTGKLDGEALERARVDLRCFERQLVDGGTRVVKFFLHISKAEQKKRLHKLRQQKTTAWRVSDEDLRRHQQYDEYLTATNEMLIQTESAQTPWTVVEATDHRFAALKIFSTVVAVLRQAIAEEEDAGTHPPAALPHESLPEPLQSSILAGVDLSLTIDRQSYNQELKKLQKRLFELEHEIYVRRVPVVIVYEGWDAAGKGGNIRRLVQNLDPRGYEVVPVAAPNDLERAHHYLWRFWQRLPKAGHLTIYDRSWYGRVLVERVEGFCHTREWRRAYREINEFERHLVNYGCVVLKFWLHIDKDEQLRRFERRQENEFKRWKITDEDWRNREKWDDYREAVEEMLFRTSTPTAPWTVVEANCKLHARLRVLRTVKRAIERQLKRHR